MKLMEAIKMVYGGGVGTVLQKAADKGSPRATHRQAARKQADHPVVTENVTVVPELSGGNMLVFLGAI